MNEKISANEFRDALNRHLSNLKADPYLAQRIIANEEGEKPGMKKISVSLAAACIFIIIMMSAALAVGNLVPGIREMLGLDRSADTENMVQTVSYNWETDYNTATVREMLYDGQGVYIAVDVQKKPRDDILLIPSGNQKLSLRSSASNLGKQDVENGETIAEYAGRKGMTVVYFSIKAENAGKTFSASVNPGDIIAVEEEHWTLVLRFPAVDQNEQIRLCLYATAHDRESPIAEPHSITVNVPDFQDISDEKIVTDAVSVVENSALKGFTIQEAKLIRTPIATYLDVWIGNTNQTEYSTIHAAITPLGIAKPEHYHFESPQRFLDGYSAGVHAIELFPEEDFRCSAFQVDLSVLPMQTAGETAGTYQLKNTGSVTITFEDSDN